MKLHTIKDTKVKTYLYNNYNYKDYKECIYIFYIL